VEIKLGGGDELSLRPIAILAGGLGTRLGDRSRDTPKALMPVAGQPFIFHQLRLLADHGARRVILCVGHLGQRIADAVGDGANFGLDVRYSFDGARPIGTAAALRQALDLLGDAFLVTYGDTYLRVDYAAVEARFEASHLPARMTVLRNDGAWGESNAVYDDGRVTAYDKRVTPVGATWIDYGLLAFQKDALDDETGPSDLAEVCAQLAARGELAGYVARERFYEIGTPEGLAVTDAFLRRVHSRD
jgi:NDP-sugar pyrophosphorylase family protein